MAAIILLPVSVHLKKGFNTFKYAPLSALWDSNCCHILFIPLENYSLQCFLYFLNNVSLFYHNINIFIMYTSVTCTPFILSSHVNLYLSFFQLIPTLRVLINASNSFDLDAPEARKTLVVLVCHLAILRANKQKLELDRQRSLLLKAPAKSPSSRKDTRASARSFVGSPDGVSSLCNPQSFF